MKRTIVCVSVLALAALAAQATEGKWVAGDFHQHTNYTDGGNIFDFVMQKNVEYGLDWWANSEHGGERNRDGIGANWDDPNVYVNNPPFSVTLR